MIPAVIAPALVGPVLVDRAPSRPQVDAVALLSHGKVSSPVLDERAIEERRLRHSERTRTLAALAAESADERGAHEGVLQSFDRLAELDDLAGERFRDQRASLVPIIWIVLPAVPKCPSLIHCIS